MTDERFGSTVIASSGLVVGGTKVRLNTFEEPVAARPDEDGCDCARAHSHFFSTLHWPEDEDPIGFCRYGSYEDAVRGHADVAVAMERGQLVVEDGEVRYTTKAACGHTTTLLLTAGTTQRLAYRRVDASLFGTCPACPAEVPEAGCER